MQLKTERFEMRLDPGTLEKLDAWRKHQADIPSRAEAVRRLMETGLSETESSPLKLSDGEKLIVLMLCEIYKHHEIDGEIDPSFVKEALLGGHYWALGWQHPFLFDMEADNRETVHEVVDVLNVWWFLEQSYARLSEKDKDRVRKETEPFDDVVFQGFDGNEEPEYLSIAEFLINKMNRFADFKGRYLNSHMPSIERHRRMVRAFKPIKPYLGGGNLLSAEHIIEILNAQRPDSL